MNPPMVFPRTLCSPMLKLRGCPHETAIGGKEKKKKKKKRKGEKIRIRDCGTDWGRERERKMPQFDIWRPPKIDSTKKPAFFRTFYYFGKSHSFFPFKFSSYILHSFMCTKRKGN